MDHSPSPRHAGCPEGAPLGYAARPMIIDGKAVAARVRAEVAEKVAELKRRGVATGLTVVRVGEDPASAVYVRNKIKACAEVGIVSTEHHPDDTIGQADLLALIARLNADPAVHGILVQLPLPKQISEQVILEAISPAKDADGFHPFNVGCLWTGKPAPRACTPFGVMRLLDEAKVDLKGKHALVVGRSNIVGKPQAAMLLERHATVTLAHSRTKDLPSVCRSADVLVAAVGRPGLVEGGWVKPGSVVVDVGINRVTDASLGERIFAKEPKKLATLKEKGAVLCGDVRYGEAMQVASAVTPVPGGVGPLTIAGLLTNTLHAANQLD